MGKKIAIIVLLIIMSISVFAGFKYQSLKQNNINQKQDIKREVKKVDKDKENDNIDKSDISNNENLEIKDTPKNEEPKKDTNKTVTNKNNNSNTSTEKNNTNNNVQSNTNQNNKNSVNNNQQSQEVSKPVEPVKKPIWEQLGMTENHYYNEPMYSWERVDFASSKYGSEANTKKACLEYGDKYEPYINGEVSFNCSTVTSTSGKYLGEMFYTEKIS